MKIAFLFPGQGSQTIGMGQDLYEKYNDVKQVYDKVKQITNLDIIALSNSEEINQTKNTQICILTMSLAILEVLKKNNIKAQYECGLSLGEYSALIDSGILTFEDGVKIVQKRGEYMQNLAPQGDWLMSAILGFNKEQVEKICNRVNGFVVPVNYNCPGQIVVSGEKSAVEEATEIAKQEGAKAVMLKTAGPFHTEKLEQAANKLYEELEKIELHSSNIKVAKNIDGNFYSENDNIKQILAKHITNPVHFEKCLQTMLNDGVDTFVEVGPGKTLSGFVKKISKEVNVYSVKSVETLEKVIGGLKNG